MASASLSKSMSSLLFLLCLLAATARLSSAAVYKVGDSAGWTIIGNPNYTAWASGKTFHEGDTILFVYNKNFHNVLQVSKAAFSSCNASSPLATYTTGNDSILIKSSGDHFFICGVPGHCSLGQKVDIKVSTSGSSAAPSPAATPPSSEATPPSGGGSSVPAPAPKTNSATSTYMGSCFVLAVAGVAAISSLIMG